MNTEIVVALISVAVTIIGMIVSFNSRSKEAEHRLSLIENEQKHLQKSFDILENRMHTIEKNHILLGEIKIDIGYLKDDMNEVKEEMKLHKINE